MDYKDILYNLALRYGRAVSNIGKKVGAKGIEEIVQTYAPTVEKDRATDEHRRQYAAFLSDISGIVVDKEISGTLGWKEVVIGMVLGVGGGIYVGTTTSAGGLAVLGGLAIGTGIPVVTGHVVRSLSYARQLSSVVEDYALALYRVDEKQLEAKEHEHDLLLDSAIAMQKGDKRLIRKTTRSIKQLFGIDTRPKRLPPKRKK